MISVNSDSFDDTNEIQKDLKKTIERKKEGNSQTSSILKEHKNSICESETKKFQHNDGFKEILNLTYLSLVNISTNSKVKPIIENLIQLKEKLISFQPDEEFYNVF